MANYLATIPVELKTAIFGCLNDLDDALHLSQVCNDLRILYHERKRPIARQIILSSYVYEFDIYVSRLQIIANKIALHYKRGIALDHFRPPLQEYTIALETKESKQNLLDFMVDDISLRWDHFSFLRDLYVDARVSHEFKRFRAHFASDLSVEAKATIVKKGLPESSLDSSHFNHCQFERNNRFGPDFKARFHRSLCLHSMAILGLRVGKVSKDQPQAEGTATRIDSEMFATEVKTSIEDLWIKKSVVTGGTTTFLNRDTKIDCLEVFDFLYMFLLKKVVLHEQLASWIGRPTSHYPGNYTDYDYYTKHALGIRGWYYWLICFRLVLEPEALKDYVDHKIWDNDEDGSFSQLKMKSIRDRAMFDPGPEGDVDWETPFRRCRMIRELQETEEVGKIHDEESCWWDRLRTRLGPPFLLDAIAKYSIEIDKIGERERERKREEKGKGNSKLDEDGEA